MEWAARQHLEVHGIGSDGVRPQCGAFHHSQALFAAAVGRQITEFDALTGCKLSSVDVGAPVVRMAYSPAGGHLIVAVLEDWTIKSWDLDTEHTHVLHSPERRSDKVAAASDVHIALTPLRPWLFFGAHRRLSVNVVGTIEGVKAPAKIKTDLKKPITGLACHPRSPLLYVAYAEGLIRAYHIQTYTVQYTLQLDNSVKLFGAGAFGFHPTLEWVFVGDGSGTLIAWDVSVPTQPGMIGITQVGSNAITVVAWHSMLRLLVTLSSDGLVHVWRTRVFLNTNKPPMRANFFESAGVEALDIAKVFAQSGSDVVYPLPKVDDFLLHPKLNLAILLFANLTPIEEARKRAGSVSRESRRQLFSVLQSARGSSGSVLKEKLSSLSSTGFLQDYQVQLQLQQARSQQGLTISDFARKAFLYARSESRPRNDSFRLPLLTIADPNHHLRDIPVCQPFHQELHFFNSEQGIFNYPARAFFMDGCNLSAYNLVTGDYNIYKKLSPTALGGSERSPTHMLYSAKQHLFIIFFECRGATSEIVIYRESLTPEASGDRLNTEIGRDGAFLGFKENRYAILDEDGLGLTLYTLEDDQVPDKETNGALDPTSFSETHGKPSDGPKGSMQFVFDNPVQRIFSTPLDSLLLYAAAGSHIGLTRVYASGYGVSGEELSTKQEDGRFLKLRPMESVLQVRWQEALIGQFAGIMTTERVMIVSQNMEIINATSSTFDKGFPPFRSLVWVGPALLFSTPTTVALLGWDGPACPITTLPAPNAGLVGTLNDRLLLACYNEPNPRQKQSIEIKARLVGLLEPLLIGWTTLQLKVQPKLDLSEILFRLTSRFDSLRVTPNALNALARGPSICGELAVELAQAGPQFTQELRCKYAIQARRFTTALSILKDEYLRSRDYPLCPRTSRLFQRFQELGRACIKYGQFDRAKETFDTVSDFQSMLDLFLCHLNPSALRRLVQKLEETGADPELRRLAERILLGRSSGWGQGGVFANFSAESLAPRGPEWAGGNWEIKTFPEVKNAPEWELAGDVTAYMKTPNGAIPTLIPDHIGVYFGTVRGRGTVVEVRDDALVKRLTTAENGFNKPALPSPVESKTTEDSLLAKITKTAPPAPALIDAVPDEQAKAAEEFKKGMYGVEDTSSDEDEASTAKKKIRIKIRDKPATTGVDVDKVKEATKQFKLADGLPPRARRPSAESQGSFGSSTSSQDILGTLSTQSSIEPTPTPIVMGMGVSASSGPIPEDFFKSEPPPVRPSINLQPDVFSLTSGPATANGGLNAKPLANGASGIPQSNGIPQEHINSNELSLPDGGVPPQAASATVAPTQQNDNITTSPAQLNLGSLERNGLAPLASGAPAQKVPPSPPRQLKPGQVPRGAPASVCYQAALTHLEQNQLADAMSCLDEAFLAMAKERSLGADIKAQAKICAQYKVAVLLLQEIGKLQKVEGPGAVGAKEEIARLARHLSVLPLQAKHRLSCIRTAIKRNMDVQNYRYAKSQLDLLLSKAPANKQQDLRSLVNICVQRGLTDKTIDDNENPSEFCAATLGRLPTIGHDSCDLCGSKFSALASPGCTICGMGTVRRSDAAGAPAASPFV